MQPIRSAVIQIRRKTGVFILFLVLSPPLVLPVKTSNIFRLLNEVCIQTTFRNESDTTAVVKIRLFKAYRHAFQWFHCVISMRP